MRIRVIKKGYKRVEMELPRATSINQVLLEVCKKYELYNDYDFRLSTSPYRDDNVPFLEDAKSLAEIFPRKKKVTLYMRKVVDLTSPQGQGEGSSVGQSPSQKVTQWMFGNRAPEIKKKFKNDTIYLSVLLYNANRQILQTTNGLLPSFEVPSETLEGEFTSSHEDFQWMVKKSLEWENQNTQRGHIWINLEEEIRGLNDLRRAFVQTMYQMKETLGHEFFGILHDSPVVVTKQDITYLVVIKDISDVMLYSASATAGVNSSSSVSAAISTSTQSLVSSNSSTSLLSVVPDVLKNGTLLWKPASDLNQTLYPPSNSLWLDFGRVYKERNTPFPPGLYVSLFYPSNANGLNVLVSKTRR